MDEGMRKVFPVCAVTKSQTRMFQDVVDLADTFYTVDKTEKEKFEMPQVDQNFGISELRMSDGPLTQKQLISAQKSDESL